MVLETDAQISDEMAKALEKRRKELEQARQARLEKIRHAHTNTREKKLPFDEKVAEIRAIAAQYDGAEDARDSALTHTIEMYVTAEHSFQELLDAVRFPTLAAHKKK